MKKNIILVMMTMILFSGCFFDNTYFFVEDAINTTGNLTINNSLFFQGGSEITDNSTCLILKSPNASDRIEICDNNTIKMFSGNNPIYFLNTTDSFFFNTITGDGSGLINVPFNDSDTNASLWTLDMNNQILPKDFARTLFVNDLIVNSSNSISLGGLGFSTINAVNQSTVINASRIIITIDRSFVMNTNFSGSTFLVGQNLNNGTLSNSVVAASNDFGSSIYFQKWTEDYIDSLLGQIVQNGGNSEWIIKRNNMNINPTGMNQGGTPFNINTGANNIRFGFFDDTILDNNINIGGYTNISYLFEINQNNLTSLKSHHFDDTLYINATYNISPLTSPPLVADKFALFGRDDQNLYVKRPNGEIKRISLVGSGSSVFSEVTKFNNHSYFFGNVYLNNSVYNGAGVGFACIDGIGRIFKSATACDITIETFTRGNITDPTMGDE